ncbi:MAG: hypothetical protein ACXW5U_07345 [Thermoanaerobaculia bacterium]
MDKIYDADFRDMVWLGGTNPSVQYHFVRDKFFAVTVSHTFVDITPLPPQSMLPDIEAQWGRGTAVDSGREWRSRDQILGLTIARWKTTTNFRGDRVEQLRIWSADLEAELRRIEADPTAPEHAQIRAEREALRRDQQREKDRYKM